MTDETEALGGNLPQLDLENPANLEAFYGSYAFFDHYRKAILSQCWELERAKVPAGEKSTEAKLENLARLNPIYLDFLAVHFKGRERREQNIWESLRNGA